MRKKNVFVGLFLALFFAAQLPAQTRTVKGFCITASHQKVSGEFEIPVQYMVAEPNYNLLQWSLLMKKNNAEYYLLNPQNTAAFSFVYKGKQYLFKATKNKFGLRNPFKKSDDKVFLKTEVSGQVSLLSVFKGSANGKTNFMNEDYYLKRGNDLVKVKSIGFRKQLKKYFSSHSKFIQLIDNHKFKKKDLPKLIQYFNKYLGTVVRT